MKTAKTARQAYTEKQAAIAEKLARLQALLDEKAANFDGKSWGSVGDLAYIDELLATATAHLSGEEI